MIPDNARRKWREKYYPVPANKVSKSDALEHSIQKWRGLQLPVLVRYGLSVNAQELKADDGWRVLMIDTGTCALCNHYYDNVRGCPRCPLTREAIAGQIGCYNAYRNFVFGDAKPMLDALLRARRRQQRKGGS